MIIYSDKPGQLGNMLFIYEALIAWGSRNKVQVLNPGFFAYSKYFQGTWNQDFFSSRILFQVSSLLARALIRYKVNFRFFSGKGLQLNEFYNLDVQGCEFVCGVHFLRGWEFRSPDSVVSLRSEIRAFFTPRPSYQLQLDSFFREKLRNDDALIIGVHIRRGDYLTFEGGRFFYSNEVYSRYMRLCVPMFAPRRIKFLLCSNEIISAERLDVGEVEIVNGLGSELLDLYSLARCDFIIGPPSTFSAWASNYGDVPLFTIRDVEGSFSKEDFRLYG